MALPFVSLDAATAVGPGESLDLEGSYDHHTMVVTADTGAGHWTVFLEGSHDEINWVQLVNTQYPQAKTVPQPGGDTTLVRYVRANLTSLGGTTPTITVTIASKTNEED
jgi:hypothetical protein